MIYGWNWVTLHSTAVWLLSPNLTPFRRVHVKIRKTLTIKRTECSFNSRAWQIPSYFARCDTLSFKLREALHFQPVGYFVVWSSEGWGRGVKLCVVILPLSRCRMFQLWPPSAMAVVSGPGPDVNTAPAFVLTRPPQETSPIWLLCIPKYAYPIAIDECRPLQSRANISSLSGKASEGRSMFWIWFGRSALMGSGRIWPIRVGSPCLAVSGVF